MGIASLSPLVLQLFQGSPGMPPPHWSTYMNYDKAPQLKGGWTKFSIPYECLAGKAPSVCLWTLETALTLASHYMKESQGGGEGMSCH